MSWRNSASVAVLATAISAVGIGVLPAHSSLGLTASAQSLRHHPRPTPTATPTPTPTSTPPGGTQKVNIFAYTGGTGNPAAIVASLPREVNGVSWLFPWATIEPSPGVYNWAVIDQAISAAAASGRTSMVRVIPGSKSPSWVHPTVTFFDTPNGPVAPKQVTMPIPWSSGFLQAYTTFLAAYGARYDGNPNLYAVQLPGAGILGEMNVGGWVLPGGANGWTAAPPTGAGATDADFVGSWNTIIDAARQAFPRTGTVLDLGEPLRDGKVQPPVLAHAQSFGAAMFLQQNGLKSSVTSSGPYFRILSAASTTTTVGWQMYGGTGSAGNLMTAFGAAIASHADYVEVYLADTTNPANAAALLYLAAG